MKKENRNLDELFRERLNFDNDVFLSSENDWEVLEKRLELSEKYKQRLLLYKIVFGVAAALLVFFSIWYLMPDNYNLQEPQKRISMEKKLIGHDTLTLQNEEPVIKTIEEADVIDGFTNSEQSIKPIVITNDINKITRNKIDKSLMGYTMISGDKPIFEMNNQQVYQLPIKKTNDQNYSARVPIIRLDTGVQPIMERKRNIVLSVFAAPALNGVRGFRNGEVGNDLGFLISVGLTKRLHISTGAVYAKKLYEADFNKNIYPNIGGQDNSGGYGEYNNSNGSDRIFPEEVFADCRVLDIPLNINYTLMKKGQNELSIGTGMSSYIMLREKYRFEYEQHNSINAETLNLRNENKHLMSIINFQASYTRQLNSKVGISLQPYLKIPLTDIGYAKVKLQSVGMAVNVNFTLNSNKK